MEQNQKTESAKAPVEETTKKENTYVYVQCKDNMDVLQASKILKSLGVDMSEVLKYGIDAYKKTDKFKQIVSILKDF